MSQLGDYNRKIEFGAQKKKVYLRSSTMKESDKHHEHVRQAHLPNDCDTHLGAADWPGFLAQRSVPSRNTLEEGRTELPLTKKLRLPLCYFMLHSSTDESTGLHKRNRWPEAFADEMNPTMFKIPSLEAKYTECTYNPLPLTILMYPLIQMFYWSNALMEIQASSSLAFSV